MVRLRLPNVRRLGKWIAAHRRQLLLYGGGGFVALVVLLQICYPTDRLLPFASIDGVNLGWQTRSEAVKRLNRAYDAYKLPIYMGDDDKPTVTPTLKQASITVDNTTRVGKVDYAWYWRFVPTSLLWAHTFGVGDVPAPVFASNFEAYVDEKLMPQCRKAPVNASLKAVGETLEVVPAQSGGSCEQDSVIKTLSKITPDLTEEISIRVAQTKLAPEVDDVAARALAATLAERLAQGVPMMVNGDAISVPARDVYAWLDFAVTEGVLTARVNAERAGSWLEANVAAKVAVKPGVSYIKTIDFTETSRVNGSEGRAIDVAGTVSSLQQVVNGSILTALTATVVVPPTEEYTRTYSPTDTGLSALLANYAKDHTGTFGISLVELDGKKRRADYQGDKTFVTASTYKLFAAYELLKQIDAGKRSWSMEATCFNKMISVSDNTCAEGYLDSLGLSTISKDIQAIGLKNSTFMKTGGPFTTANDLTLLLGMLQSQQNFSSANRERFISALKGNIYRKGIPAGVSGTVADKVGFMDNLLHDAAIVYGPKGTYVLAIMTEDSSWATIADLARQIDTLRAQ
jgi:beta-lactamase class A